MEEFNFDEVAVLLPTFNEIGNISKLLIELRHRFPLLRIVVIDDRSPDGTGQAAEQFAHGDAFTWVIHRDGKRGLGRAYKEGFSFAFSLNARYIVTMDSDFSHQPELLGNLVFEIATGSDIAIGSRFVPGGSIVGWPRRRNLLSRFGNQYARRMIGLNSLDCTSGYRAYRSSAVKAIGLNSIRGNGYIIQISLLRRAKLSGLRVAEVPITFIDRVEGQSKMSLRIVAESMLLVTLFGLKDLLRRRR